MSDSISGSPETVSRQRSRDRLLRGRSEMHPEDLMKTDLLSEIMLLGTGGLIFFSLLLVVVTMLTRA